LGWAFCYAPSFRILMKTNSLQGLLLSALFATAPVSAQDQIQDTRDVLDRWVETRRIISEEKSDWRTEKTILTDTKDLLSSELERLEQAISDLEESATAADKEREELAAEKERLNAASDVVEKNLGGLEAQLKRITAMLPDPLVDKIKPLIRRLPDDPTDTDVSLGQRVQNIVGILSQADKFNTTITLTSESQELESGKLVQVSTLYWGVATAYFVDDSGTYGGYGVPAEDGWEWTEVEGAGPAIRELLSVYDGSSDTIKFVQVPAVIK